MNKALYEALLSAAGNENVRENELMSRHTTFRIGGPADLFVTAQSEQILRECIRLCRETGQPWYLIGNGSNLLVSDQGCRCVILQPGRGMSQVSAEGNYLRAQAGAMLAAVARGAMNEGLCGLEFASGIPGTLGGAVFMNAGAYGVEMKDVVTSVRVLTPQGEVLSIPGDQMEFGYRTSIVQKRDYVVLSAEMKLTRGEVGQIMARMNELKEKRCSRQPLEMPSAGSTFKRPEGNYAGKLIMEAGLAGLQVGGAAVSRKHCGFVVNEGGATAEDVRELIRQVQARVSERFGVELEPEVRMLGEFA